MNIFLIPKVVVLFLVREYVSPTWSWLRSLSWQQVSLILVVMCSGAAGWGGTHSFMFRWKGEPWATLLSTAVELAYITGAIGITLGAAKRSWSGLVVLFSAFLVSAFCNVSESYQMHIVSLSQHIEGIFAGLAAPMLGLFGGLALHQHSVDLAVVRTGVVSLNEIEEWVLGVLESPITKIELMNLSPYGKNKVQDALNHLKELRYITSVRDGNKVKWFKTLT